MASRKTVKKAEELRISQIGDFKKRLGGIMELPSGVTVRAVNPGGMRVFMKNKLIPNSLMVIIEESMKTKVAPSQEKFMNNKGEIDDDMMADMEVMLDNVAITVIKEPKVLPRLTQADLDKWNAEHPDDQAEDIEDIRSMEVIYADEFPDDDKQFLFQWVSGGTRDLEEFRAKREQQMAGLSAVAGDGDGPAPAVGLDKR